ncbi:MAG: hypothetical protein ABSC41_02000 [Acidimicrobiales bacterium]
MIATALGLVATAILTALLLGTMLGSNGTPATGISNGPGVAEATALQAQQTLTAGLTTVETAAISTGGYGSLQPSALTASDPSITFVAGPSTDSDTISISVTGGTGGTGGAGGVGGTGGGTVTLADRSTGGTCWLVWKGAGGGTWYGAETAMASCTAPAISSTPSPGPVSSSSIGWQPGSFPDA